MQRNNYKGYNRMRHRHRWKWYGKQSAFCVKCGFPAGFDMSTIVSCTMSDKTWKENYPHLFEKTIDGNKCIKCGIFRSQMLIFYRVINQLPYWIRESHPCKVLCLCPAHRNYYKNGKKIYSPSIKIPCTLNHTEGIIKDIIE